MKKLLILFALFCTAFAVPSKEYKLISEKSHFEIKGTSTLHDWTMESRQATGEAVIHFNDGRIHQIESLKISLPVESLKSGKSAMDKNAYDALKTNKHTHIQFDLTGIERIEQKGEEVQIRSKGKLTIAGNSRSEELIVLGKNHGDLISFEGSKAIKMSDYQVEAPSFMFGSVKTGDEITVSFNIQFSKNSINQ